MGTPRFARFTKNEKLAMMGPDLIDQALEEFHEDAREIPALLGDFGYWRYQEGALAARGEDSSGARALADRAEYVLCSARWRRLWVGLCKRAGEAVLALDDTTEWGNETIRQMAELEAEIKDPRTPAR